MLLCVFLLSFLIQKICGSHLISVYADVLSNTTFFTRTFPWLIDNIGGDIAVDYYLLGSGRYSVPQMCALYDLKLNTYLQAQYLKCEAMGRPSEDCLCEAGVEHEKYKQCVLTGGPLASSSAAQYLRLRVEITPVIEIGPKNTIFAVEDIWYLKKICTIFGDDLPLGCLKPLDVHGPGQTMMSLKKSVVNYKCDCAKVSDEEKLLVTTPPPV